MCGRYTLTLDPGELQESLELGPFLQMYQPRYNIAPSQPVAVVRDPAGRAIELMQWGLIPSWQKNVDAVNAFINARSETVHQKPTFRNAFKYRRCLILADGFFEWAKLPGASGKTPYYFQVGEGEAITFAGLYEIWKSPEGDSLPTCTILTCPPNALVSPYHNRMPVILPEDARWEWVNASQDTQSLLNMLQPFPAEWMQVREVSKLINNPKVDSAEVLA